MIGPAGWVASDPARWAVFRLTPTPTPLAPAAPRRRHRHLGRWHGCCLRHRAEPDRRPDEYQAAGGLAAGRDHLAVLPVERAEAGFDAQVPVDNIAEAHIDVTGRHGRDGRDDRCRGKMTFGQVKFIMDRIPTSRAAGASSASSASTSGRCTARRFADDARPQLGFGPARRRGDLDEKLLT